MILDTTFLVDLQREFRRDETGSARRFLDEHGEGEVAISFVTWMEFAERFDKADRDACTRFLASFRVFQPDLYTAWRAGQIARELGERGGSIGDHDVWIAAVALQHKRAVVTANDRHFRRVPGLAVLGY